MLVNLDAFELIYSGVLIYFTVVSFDRFTGECCDQCFYLIFYIIPL